MRRYLTGLGLVSLALAGCATPKPPELGYLAPTGLPPTARTASIQRQPGLLVGNLVDRLQQDGFRVTHLDEQAGEVVVEYEGDPEPYVDCGWIVTYQPGALDRIPAARARASFDRRVNQSLVKMDRQLQLDGRMVIRLEQEGPGTLVSPAATYVLTKTIDLSRPDGTPRGRSHETISFGTGEAGQFSKGTVCQPNGRLERVVLDSLPAVSVVASAPRTPAGADGSAVPSPTRDEDAGAPRAVGAEELAAPAASVADEPTAQQAIAPAAPPPPPTPPSVTAESVEKLQAQVDATTAALSCAAVDASLGDGNRVRLTGHVSNQQDIAEIQQALGQIDGLGAIETDLEVDPWPMCELLGVLAPYRPEATDAQPALSITTASRNTQLLEGDDLTLDIYLPRMARYLYLGYVQHDGRVGYIATMPVREWAEGTGAIRFATGFQISEPYGREMIVAVASAHPLFEQARPGYEPAGDYIEELRERLATLQADDPVPSVAVNHLFITTGPKRAL